LYFAYYYIFALEFFLHGIPCYEILALPLLIATKNNFMTTTRNRFKKQHKTLSFFCPGPASESGSFDYNINDFFTQSKLIFKGCIRDHYYINLNLSLDALTRSPNPHPHDLGRVLVSSWLPVRLRVGYGFPAPTRNLISFLVPFRFSDVSREQSRLSSSDADPAAIGVTRTLPRHALLLLIQAATL
jgi:hypothetical protein